MKTKKLHTHLVGIAEVKYCDCDEPLAEEPLYYRIDYTLTTLKYLSILIMLGAVIAGFVYIISLIWR